MISAMDEVNVERYDLDIMRGERSARVKIGNRSRDHSLSLPMKLEDINKLKYEKWKHKYDTIAGLQGKLWLDSMIKTPQDHNVKMRTKMPAINNRIKESVTKELVGSLSRADMLNSKRFGTNLMSTCDSRIMSTNDEELTLTSRYKREKINRLQPLKMSMSNNSRTFAESIDCLKNLPKIDNFDESFSKHLKNNDSSWDYSKIDDLKSMMKKIKETPSYMRDYKNDLETSMMKKKLGLEQIDPFHLTLHQANIEQKKHKLAKFRNNSLKITSKRNEKMIHLKYELDESEDTLIWESKTKPNLLNRFIFDSTHLKKNLISKNKIVLKKDKMESFNRSLKSKKHSNLKPLEVRENSQSPLLVNHLQKISDIISCTYDDTIVNHKKPKKASIKISEIRRKSGHDHTKYIINEPNEQSSDDASNKSFPLASQNGITNFHLQVPHIIDNGEEIKNQTKCQNSDTIEDINFINLLMHIDGKDRGISVANDRQFEEIWKLMDEYYGLSDSKILNKYELWK